MIRHLDGQAEYDQVGAHVMDWRRKRNLPAENARPVLEALRDEREMVALVDTDTNTPVAVLQLHRTTVAAPPWTLHENARPTLVVSCAATAPGNGYRLGWLLTIWARHYAALCGYTRIACAVPLRHADDWEGQRLVGHLVSRCGWDRVSTAASEGTAVLLAADACRAEGLEAYLGCEVPVQPALLAEEGVAS
ncbi:hypothetical protein AB0N81_40625 [Streptomyces sp. NPDC093510]|uniref:hypothetical protein n=1 Tax=Streptomyces sp. NPDC093510 TaxID=3155199 RepID=UPI003449FCB9